MADAHVDLELAPELALDYVEGAEAGLQGDFKADWDAVVAAFPALTLSPLFAEMDLNVLADMVDSVRLSGEEPPDPFTSFSIVCDDTIATSVRDAVAALPFVAAADVRPDSINASVVAWGTNPEMENAFQVLRATGGVDAIHGWQIEGGTGRNVRVADIEDAWDLSHDDLIAASVQRVSTFDAGEPTHGNGALGIIVASDNGVGIVGIAPDAQAFLVTTARAATGARNPPVAVAIAAAAVGPGGVVLIEQALPFFAQNPGPDILWEFHPQTQKAIRLATLAGVTVVEPAGNAGVDLDAFAFFEHVQPGKPRFVDSGAIVVGAGGPLGEVAQPTWRRTFSTFGKRVDCFAAGRTTRAPSSAPSDYQFFSGTSGASAIVAGVVCALQGMALAANNQQPLPPADIRRRLRDPALGTPTDPGQPGGIGSMPDLRKIARQLRFARILPVTLVSAAPDAMNLFHLDDDDTLVRRDWNPVTLWGNRVALDPAGASFFLTPQRPAALVSNEPALARVVTDVVALAPDASVHLVAFDALTQISRLEAVRASPATLALGSEIAAVRPQTDTLVIVGIDPNARLVAFTGDANLHLATGLAGPVVIDPFATYRRAAGPALVARDTGTMHVVAIDDGGNLRFASGTVLATIGTGWAPPIVMPPTVVLNPVVRPALVATASGFIVLAVGTDGLLHSGEIALAAPFFVPLTPVDAGVAVSATGPVALAISGPRLAALVVGADRVLRAAFRDAAPGSAWTTLDPIDPDVAVSPLGGASVVALGDAFGAAAVLPDGRPCWSRFVSNIGWLPLRVA
jgi:hypothetical protein